MVNAPSGSPVSPHPQGQRDNLVRAALVFVVLAVTLGGLHTILQGAEWWLLCVMLWCAMLGAATIMRAVLPTRNTLVRLAAPVVALCVGGLIVMLRFGGGTGFQGTVPDTGTWAQFGALVRASVPSIMWQSVPAKADEPILFVLALGAIVLALVAEILVFSVRLPALLGLPLAAVFLTPSVTADGETDGWFFAASAMVYLALLMVGRDWQPTTALTLAAAAVAGGVVLPAALPGIDFALTTSDIGPSVSTGVNPILHLGDDLRDTKPRTALTYSTVSGQPSYLRLSEISDFSGESWGPDQPSLDPQNRLSDFPLATGLTPAISTQREITYIHVANLSSPWLPVPYAATRITWLKGSWRYQPDSLTVASKSDLARGANYTVSSQQITPTPDQLLAAGSSIPPGLERYLALPEDTPTVIGATARKVTAKEMSNYEKALALQQYLRAAPFYYSESAPQTGGYDNTGVKFVAAFLEQGKGYCIHFASAMAVMAREIGIPSRIIVGFQPGTLQSETDQGRRLFAVTTKDLHAWPELYFDGIGWVRFEPTPSRGSVPAYADQSTLGVPSVVTPGTGVSPTTGRDPSSGSPEIDDGPVVATKIVQSTIFGWLIFGGVILALIIVLLIPATLRKVRRWGRLSAVSAGHGRVVLLWREIVETAEDVGNSYPPTLTPREMVARLRRLRGMSDEAREAIERVGDALERERYGPPSADAAAVVEANSTLVRDTKTILKGLLAGVPPDERLRALLLPPSLVTRAKAVVARSNNNEVYSGGK